jgi:hypothetical protein
MLSPCGVVSAQGKTPKPPVLAIDGQTVTSPWENKHDYTGLPMTSEGWTDLLAMYQHPDLYKDSRIIYVSSSAGNDATAKAYTVGDPAVGADPFMPAGAVSAFKSIDAAASLMRDGYPDVLLFRRGDTFTTGIGQWKSSGRSSQEPQIIASYGPGSTRPTFVLTGGLFFSTSGGGGSPAFVGNFIVADLHARQDSKDPASSSFRAGLGGTPLINVKRAGSDILFEDLLLEFGQINFEADNAGGVVDLTIRRSIIVDNYSTNSHAQGIYADGLNGLLIEDCLLDHNGWYDGVSGAEPTIYNHNLYMQTGNTNVIIRGSISARASSHGLQFRPGGIMENNLFLDNSISAFISSAGGIVRRNVVIGGRNMDSSTPRGWGLSTQSVSSVEMYDNIVAAKNAGVGSAYAYSIDSNEDCGAHSVDFHGNVAYGWSGPALRIAATDECTDAVEVHDNKLASTAGGEVISKTRSSVSIGTYSFSNNAYYSADNAANWFQNGSSDLSFLTWATAVGDLGSSTGLPSFPDPTRTVASYHSAIGGTATVAAFLAQARLQSKWNWRPQYTADAVNRYIREGFGLQP